MKRERRRRGAKYVHKKIVCKTQHTTNAPLKKSREKGEVKRNPVMTAHESLFGLLLRAATRVVLLPRLMCCCVCVCPAGTQVEPGWLWSINRWKMAVKRRCLYTRIWWKSWRRRLEEYPIAPTREIDEAVMIRTMDTFFLTQKEPPYFLCSYCSSIDNKQFQERTETNRIRWTGGENWNLSKWFFFILKENEALEREWSEKGWTQCPVPYALSRIAYRKRKPKMKIKQNSNEQFSMATL